MRESYLNECQGQCGPVAYKRKTTREKNEQGTWLRLIAEIESLANGFGKSVDECVIMYEQVSCCKKRLKLALEGTYQLWEPLEDLGVESGPGSPEYRDLVARRGQDEVDRRLKFLKD